MSAVFKSPQRVFLILLVVLIIPIASFSQKKRIKPPKRSSKIKSVDQFVDNTFQLYEKIFVYDSLTKVGVEIPSELEDELSKRAEQNLDSLLLLAPDIIDEISDASFLKQAKATINLNKAKKALKYCGFIIKDYFVSEEKDD